ncbi:hypothetical protein VST7929_00285 [Vibrio stylophorae]|uniref:Chitin-binding type-3 domain-containing protein n=1 Tax=Vibrio stylophorae TaxID=659351 RepID=A0ABN8DMX5_9VIBR|nr:lytic polysaccharide monooxygenase [Vibrio stylophorae]CAH0532456.1 hypothetical protein VST7929_00285 [Vibrio stylophorae]
MLKRTLPGLALLALSPQLFAHGYTEYPPARQLICNQQGGHWGPVDGSDIANDACRQAYLTSSWTPFIQHHEYAALVSDYQNQTAVEAVVTDGNLCSAADPQKAGMDTPSNAWQTTVVDAKGGPLKLRFHASTPHNPSFWRIYLSKPGFDVATMPLHWSDLELIGSFGDLPVLEDAQGKYYEMTVNLPADRQGKAVLYTRWQRDDPAGEGFYNCSDIQFGDNATPTYGVSLGHLIQPGFAPQVGETLRFRLFNATGQELVDEKIAITANNQSPDIWVAELAQRLDSVASGQAAIGVLEQGQLVLASTPSANQVFSPVQDATFQIESKTGNNAPVIQAPPSLTIVAGETANIALEINDIDQDPLTVTSSHGQVVMHHNQYQVTLATDANTAPGTIAVTITVSDGQSSASALTEVIVQASTGDIAQWQADVAYPAQSEVLYLGVRYQAKWWTQGDQPDQSQAWQVMSSETNAWQAATAYNAGDIVTYQGKRYQAQWWTQGDQPDQSQAWQLQP